MKTFLPAVLFGTLLFLAPVALADEARDSLLRTEAQIGSLNTSDAYAAASGNFEEAQLRLRQARAAEDRNRDEETLWRSAEASIQAEIVQEKVKLHSLERTVSEIEAGIATLRRELN